jgi:N4-gp56 family major capsid protein
MSETKTNSGYSVFIPEVWSQKLSQMLEKNCVMMQCVNRNWEGDIKNQGDTVKIISPAEVSVSTLTGEDISYSTLNPTSQDLVIDQKKFFAFKIDDVSQVQANSDIMEAHLNNAKKAIEVVQDSYLLGLHTDVVQNNTVGSETSPLKLDTTTIYSNFVKLALALKNSDAVYSGVRPWVVINPDIEAYLLQSPEFISAYKVGDETLRNGAIGRIAGMDVLVSTNLSDVDGKYYVLAGTNDAITFASQLAKIESLRDKDSFSDLVRGLYLYGAKTVQPKALAKMIISSEN